VAGPASALRLQLIGPAAVTRAGTPLPLPTRKTLALLALLAAGATSRALLATQLWSTLDEAAARRNLRRELHRLREAGLGEMLVDAGDRLALADGLTCDLREFHLAHEHGDHAACAAFGPGPLLDGLQLADAGGFDDWLSTQRAQHAEAWCGSAHALAAQLAEQGRAREALAWLARVTDTDPLHEASVRLAMRCHQQLGAPQAAVALYDRLAARLQAELGLAPLAATRELADRLRAGAPAAAAPAPARPAGDPLPARVPFVGRESAIDAMESAWAAQRSIVLVGEPGSGKTRLASDFAAAHGAFALVPCRSADRGIAYASATRALRALLASGDATVLPDWVRAELARLLPELGAPPPLQSNEERARFVAGVALGWQLLLRANFNSVLIDDWHHADEASAELFVHLAQRAHDAHAEGGEPGARLLIASRPLGAGTAAAQALARLGESGQLTRIELEPLTPTQLQLMIQQLSGASGALLFAQRLHRATGGNPLFAIETLRHLFETGLLRVGAGGGWETPFDDATQDYRELPVPPTVRAAVLARVTALGDGALRLLESASLAGDPFTLARLDGTTALSEFERVAALEAALSARLLARETPEGYRFTHDLVAQAVAEQLSPERARLLHRRLAVTAQQQGLAPARVAAHLQAAGDGVPALNWRLRAADAAEAAFAHAEALAQLTLALPAAQSAEQRVLLQLRRASIARLLLDAQSAESALADALATCADTLPQRHAARVALANHRLAADRVEEALKLLDAVIADPQAGPDDRAQALLTRATAHQKRGSAQTEVDLEAAAAQLPPGPSALRARALTGLGNSAMRRGAFAAAAQAFESSAREFEAAGAEPAGRANALWRQGAALNLLGEQARATDLLEHGLAEARRAHHIGHQRGAILNLVKVLTQTGELERAARLLEQGMALSPAFSSPAEETALRQSAYYVAYLRGELGQALQLADAAIAHADGTAEVYWKVGARMLVADLALHLHDHERAARWLGQAQQLEREHALGYHHALLAAKQAWLALDQGNPAAAQMLLDTLADVEPAPEDALVVDHVRARTLLALNRPAEAWAAVAADKPPAALDAWTMRQAARVAAQRRLGTLDAAQLAELQAQDAAHRLPPLESQVLAAELHGALRALGQRHAAERARRRALARRARLAATLPDAERVRWLQR